MQHPDDEETGQEDVDTLDTKTVHIENIDPEKYEWMKEMKEYHGLTWEGMLMHAARNLDGYTRHDQ